MEKTTILTEQYEHHTFTVEFIVSRPLRNYRHVGKSWPITTQCVVKRDGWIIGIGEAIKHENDAINYLHGRKIALGKAFVSAERKIWKEVRERFWKQTLSETKQY